VCLGENHGSAEANDNTDDRTVFIDGEEATTGCNYIKDGLHEREVCGKINRTFRAHGNEVTTREARMFSTAGAPINQTAAMIDAEIAHSILDREGMNVGGAFIKLAKDGHGGRNVETNNLHGKNDHPDECCTKGKRIPKIQEYRAER
jgi:hypothetical protein